MIPEQHEPLARRSRADVRRGHIQTLDIRHMGRAKGLMDMRDRLWVVIGLTGLLAGCGPKPAVEGPNVNISRGALDAAVAERVRAAGPSNAVAVSEDVVRREVVRELVVGERLRAKAKDLGIADLDAAVDAAWARYKGRFGGEEFFQRYLAKQGRTERQLRREVADKVARQRVLEASAPPEKMEPTDGEIEAYYQGKIRSKPSRARALSMAGAPSTALTAKPCPPR